MKEMIRDKIEELLSKDLAIPWMGVPCMMKLSGECHGKFRYDRQGVYSRSIQFHMCFLPVVWEINLRVYLPF